MSLGFENPGVVEQNIAPVAIFIPMFAAHPDSVGEQKRVRKPGILADSARNSGGPEHPGSGAGAPEQDGRIVVLSFQLTDPMPPGF